MRVIQITLTAITLLPQVASATYIDDFTAAGSGNGWSLASPQTTLLETGLSGVLGGSRHVRAHWGDNTFGDSLALYTGSRAGRSGFFHYNSFGLPFTTELTYDAAGLGLGLDLSTADAVTIAFDPDHIGFGRPNRFKLTLGDADAGSATAEIALGTSGVSRPDWTEVRFDLRSFAGTVDLSDIASLRLSYSGDISNDAAFDYIAIEPGPSLPQNETPLPAPLWLLGAGVVVLLGLRRRATAAIER